MKRRVFLILLVLCLCSTPLPAGAFAAYQEPPTEVSSYEIMAAALPSGELDPEDAIPVARLIQNLTLTSGQSIATMGKLVIPAGVALTISDGATVEAEVEIQSGGTIVVKAGGTLATTMAGENAIANHGTITIDKGGKLLSQKGGHVNNSGSLILNGVFYCNSFYDSTSPAVHAPWFDNSGTVVGSGQVVVLKPFLSETDTDSNNDMVVSIAMTEEMKTKLSENDGGDSIAVYTQAESVAELTTLNNSDGVDGIFLSKDMTEEEAQAGNRNRFDVTADLTVTKNLWLDQKTDLYVGNGRTLTVGKDKLLHSGRGNISVATDGGILALDETALLGGSDTDACFVPTSDRIFLSAKSPDAVDPDYYPAKPAWIYLPGQTTSKASADISSIGLHLIVDSTLTLGGDLTVGSVEMRNTLNLAGHTFTATFLSLGFAPGPNAEATCKIQGTGTIDVTEEATIENCTAYIPAGVTMNLQTFYPEDEKSGVLFYNRGRIAVKAGGGMVIANNTTLLSGSGDSAVLVPTGTGAYDCAFLTSAAYRSDQDWPADWLYLIGEGTSHGGDISGFAYTHKGESGGLALIVDTGAAMSVTGDLTVGYMEQRGTTAVADTYAITATNVFYFNESSVTGTINATSSTYQCLINMNDGNGDHVADFVTVHDGKIYLEEALSTIEAYGNTYPPVHATNRNRQFSGWSISSGWDSVTADQLAAFEILIEETDGEYKDMHYVAEPTVFPITLTVQWASAGSGDTDGGGTYTNPTVTIPVSGAADTVSVKATVQNDTAVINEITATDLEKIDAGAGEVTIDLSRLSENINTAEMTKNTLTAISQSNLGLEIRMKGSAVTLDSDAVKAIKEQSDGSMVSIQIEITDQKLNDDQKEIVQTLNNVLVFDATVTSNGERISNLDGGTAEIVIPYVWDGNGTLRAAFINESGNMEFVPVSYQEGKAILSLKHFSDYAVYTVVAVPFTDVAKDAWYFDDVAYAYGNNIMQGTSQTLFNPARNTTRAMIVTMLYCLEGAPVASGISPFDDVAGGMWYTDAVIWAQENKIVAGYNSTTFGPNDDITREQMATILYCYAKYKGFDVSKSEDLSKFSDSAGVSDYAAEAFKWAVSEGLIQGTSESTLSPKNGTTRAQVAAILHRFCKNIK